MRTKSICHKCQSDNLMYKKIYKKDPLFSRIGVIVTGIICILVGLHIIPTDLDLLMGIISLAIGAVCVFVGIKKNEPKLTTIRFRCQDCQHEFDINDPEVFGSKLMKVVTNSDWKAANESELPLFAK